MTLCPIALVVGCKKCPAFSVCPVKSIIGDMPKQAETRSSAKPGAKPSARSGAKPAAKSAAKRAAKPAAKSAAKKR